MVGSKKGHEHKEKAPFCGGWTVPGLLFATLGFVAGSALIFLPVGGLKMLEPTLCASNKQWLFFLSPSLVALDADLELLGLRLRPINCDAKGGPRSSDPISAPYQSLDGSGNNVANPSWGSVGSSFRRRFPSAYSDHQSWPAGAGTRPSARHCSNELHDALLGESRVPPAAVPSGPVLTQMFAYWGQWLVFDLSHSQTNSSEPWAIGVPCGDGVMDRTCVGVHVSVGKIEREIQ